MVGSDGSQRNLSNYASGAAADNDERQVACTGPKAAGAILFSDDSTLHITLQNCAWKVTRA
jgi:hypothetical protein